MESKITYRFCNGWNGRASQRDLSIGRDGDDSNSDNLFGSECDFNTAFGSCQYT